MRRAARLAFVAVLALGLAACSGGGDDDAGTTTSSADPEGANQRPEGITAEGRSLEPVAAGKLTVCLDLPNPPFAVDEDGRTAGIDAELARALGGRLGLQAEFHLTESGSLFKDLDGRKCDMVASAVSMGNAEAKARTASEPYLDVKQALLVRAADSGRYTDLPALSGRRVGVQAGSPGAAQARQQSGVEVVELADVGASITALRESRVDAVVHDEPVVAHAAATSDQVVVTKRFDAVTDQYVLVMPKGADAFKRTIDEALRIIRRDDTYASIIRRYLGTNP